MTFPYDNETQRLSAPTTRIDYHQVTDDLSDSERWFHINRSITYIAQSVLLGAIVAVAVLTVVYGVVKSILLDIILTGISTYTLIAPAVLLVIIGYWLRGRLRQ